MDSNLQDQLSNNHRPLTAAEQLAASALRNLAFPSDRTIPSSYNIRQMQGSVNYLGERATGVAEALEPHAIGKAVREVQDSLRQTAETAKNGSWHETVSRVAGREVDLNRLGSAPLSLSTQDLIHTYNRTAHSVSAWSRDVVNKNRAWDVSTVKTDAAAILSGMASNYILDKFTLPDAPVSMRTKAVEAMATPLVFLASRVGFLGKTYALMGIHGALRIWDQMDVDKSKPT